MGRGGNRARVPRELVQQVRAHTGAARWHGPLCAGQLHCGQGNAVRCRRQAVEWRLLVRRNFPRVAHQEIALSLRPARRQDKRDQLVALLLEDAPLCPLDVKRAMSS